MREEIVFEVDQQKVRGILTDPGTKKIVIIAHGFGGGILPHTVQSKLAKGLQENGFAALEIAFRGTAPSDGKFKDMTVASEVQDCVAAIHYAKQKGFKDIALLGQSLGGTIITKAHEKKIKALVYWYTAFDLSSTLLQRYLTPEVIKQAKQNGSTTVWGLDVGYNFMQEVQETIIYDNIPSCPACFIHGDQDKVVDVNQSKVAFEKAGGPKKLEIIQGAKHNFPENYKEAIQRTVNFLKEYL